MAEETLLIITPISVEVTKNGLVVVGDVVVDKGEDVEAEKREDVTVSASLSSIQIVVAEGDAAVTDN